MDEFHKIDDVQRVEFGQYGDARGQLIVIEGAQSIPFEIKRVFYIYGADAETIRGQHANRRSCFIMICVTGSCRIRVKDAWGSEQEYQLDRPNSGLYVPPMIWKDMYEFSRDAVLLVLASEHYDAEEYIRDYAELQSDCFMI